MSSSTLACMRMHPRRLSRRSAVPRPPRLRYPGGRAVGRLQRDVGNRGLHRLLQADVIQAQLAIGPAGDEYEREANRIADEVMRMPDADPRAAHHMVGGVQRVCGRCEETQKDHQSPIGATSGAHKVPDVSPELGGYLAASRGHGVPLAPATRAFFEPRLGQALSHVRVHTDDRAAEASNEIRARAFTTGSDIYFARGQYSPGTTSGSRLLGHELTHVVQQTGAIQRQAEPTHVSEPTAEDAAYIARSVKDDFYALYNGLSQAQHGMHHYSAFRQSLIQELDALDVTEKIGQGVFDEPLTHLEQIYHLSYQLSDVSDKIRVEHERALARWAWIERQVDAERERLVAGTLEDQMALSVLERAYTEATARLNANEELTVRDDFAGITRMLQNKTHVTAGKTQSQREQEKLSEELAASEDELEALGEDDSPGVVSQVWSVVGWESFGDFLSDVALTVATGGAGKIYKATKRAKKVRAASKVRKAAQARRFAKRAEKLEKMRGAAVSLVEAIDDYQKEIGSLIRWTRTNAGGIATRIATDIAASGFAAGNVQGAASMAVNRLTKDYIQALVDDVLDVSGELAEEYLKLAFVARMAGKESSERRMTQAFLSVAFRRRGLTNLIHAAVSKTSRLDIPTDLKSLGIDLANVAITTVGEVINDFVIALPIPEEARKYVEIPVETLRKTLVNVARNALSG